MARESLGWIVGAATAHLASIRFHSERIGARNRALYGSPTVSQGDAVVQLPGIYSQSTNGETIPIRKTDEVNIQGTNALNTILDGEGSDVVQVFSPFAARHRRGRAGARAAHASPAVVSLPH